MLTFTKTVVPNSTVQWKYIRYNREFVITVIVITELLPKQSFSPFTVKRFTTGRDVSVCRVGRGPNRLHSKAWSGRCKCYRKVKHNKIRKLNVLKSAEFLMKSTVLFTRFCAS